MSYASINFVGENLKLNVLLSVLVTIKFDKIIFDMYFIGIKFDYSIM